LPATYSPTLPSDRDWCRLLIRDTNVASAILDDDEIDAALATRAAGPARKYLTAADLLDILHVAYMTKGKGVASKKVSRLTVVYGTGSGINIDIALQTAISKYRKRGAQLLQPAPFAVRAL